MKHTAPAYLFFVCLYTKRFFVCENSPNLCPTMSWVIVTGTWSFPLCTRKRIPTKFGRMVQERASVFMGVLFASASRMLGNATKNGPFHADRPERRTAEGYIVVSFGLRQAGRREEVAATCPRSHWHYNPNTIVTFPAESRSPSKFDSYG